MLTSQSAHRAGPPFARARLRTALAFAALAALVVSLPAAATLRVTPESPRGRLFKSVYDQLPPCWKANRVVVLREVSDADMDFLVGEEEEWRREGTDDSIVDGYYQPGRRGEAPIITLRKSMKDGAAEMVFAHEYAHYIWDVFLTNRQKADYLKIWDQQAISEKLVTTYAGESVEEGFSEAVSHYLLRPQLLKKRDEASYKFVQEAIAEGIRRRRAMNGEF
jgi:hypothetical protein